jgi:hypothetical protein
MVLQGFMSGVVHERASEWRGLKPPSDTKAGYEHSPDEARPVRGYAVGVPCPESECAPLRANDATGGERVGPWRAYGLFCLISHSHNFLELL